MSCDVALQGLNEADPFHGIMRLPEVKEDQEEGVVLYSGKLLGKIQLHDGHPRPSFGLEHVNNIMVVDTDV